SNAKPDSLLTRQTTKVRFGHLTAARSPLTPAGPERMIFILSLRVAPETKNCFYNRTIRKARTTGLRMADLFCTQSLTRKRVSICGFCRCSEIGSPSYFCKHPLSKAGVGSRRMDDGSPTPQTNRVLIRSMCVPFRRRAASGGYRPTAEVSPDGVGMEKKSSILRGTES